MSARPRWPHGAQAAATVTVNFDGESVDHRAMPLPLWGRYSHGRYGSQLGVRNLLALFARYGVRATFFIGGWDAERDPALIAEIAAAGHELSGHGYAHEDFSALDITEQAAALEQGEAVFERLLGARPRGFRAPERLLSAATRGLLAARGYRYDSSYADDDLPYVVRDGAAPLVELPAHEPWGDKVYYEKHRTPAAVAGALLDEFDAAYAAGCLFTLSLHPRGDYGSGRGARLRALEPTLQALRERPGLWVATCGEVAEWALAGEK